MPFEPGKSGNPGGRPKTVLADGRSLQELARDHTEAAVQTLIDVMVNDQQPAPARVGAANAILDRGWGRPKQEHDVGDNLRDMLAEIIAGRRAKVAELNEAADGDQA